MRAKQLARLGLLTAVALTIFLVEARLPGLMPVPGVKLGLSNIVTVYTVFTMGPGAGCLVLLARVVLGSAFSGQFSAIMYSLGGGALAIAVTIGLRKCLRSSQIWVAGVFGAVAHSLGQMAVAIFVTQTPGLLVYLPVMCAVSIVTGCFTGLCAQFLAARLK